MVYTCVALSWENDYAFYQTLKIICDLIVLPPPPILPPPKKSQEPLPWNSLWIESLNAASGFDSPLRSYRVVRRVAFLELARYRDNNPFRHNVLMTLLLTR